MGEHRGSTRTVRSQGGAGVILRALGAACAALLALTACGTTTTAGTTGAGTRTVVDMAGRTVTLPANVARLGTNYPAVNQMIFLLGGMDRLVATDPGEAQIPLFATMYPRLKSIATPFGASTTDVNTETLLANRPDVVFVSGNTPMVQTIENLGIKVVVLSVFNTPEQIEAGVKTVADVLGGDAPARAQKFTEYYNGNVARATAATAGIPVDSQPKVFYTAGNPLQTEGGGSIVTTWMKQGGARNIAAENGVTAPPTFATVSIEDVVRWNPDFVICRDTATKQQILQDPRWSSVAAVRNNRVFINPKGVFVWSVRSSESALQPLWAARTFHPDLFGTLDIRKEVQDFYHTFYDYTLTDQQLDGILNPT